MLLSRLGWEKQAPVTAFLGRPAMWSRRAVLVLTQILALHNLLLQHWETRKLGLPHSAEPRGLLCPYQHLPSQNSAKSFWCSFSL